MNYLKRVFLGLGTNPELRALRQLREVCGMYCEQLPVEVREALHAIPNIEKTHTAHRGRGERTDDLAR